MALLGFLAKKLISRLVLPLGQVLVLWLAGALVWWRRPAKRTGPLLMVIAGLWLLALSMPITGGLLLHQLEAQNWQYASPAVLSDQGVRDIVVLAGGSGNGEVTESDRYLPKASSVCWRACACGERCPEPSWCFRAVGFWVK